MLTFAGSRVLRSLLTGVTQLDRVVIAAPCILLGIVAWPHTSAQRSGLSDQFPCSRCAARDD